jgi:hypothetical protein
MWSRESRRERGQPTPELTIQLVQDLEEFASMRKTDVPGWFWIRLQGAGERVDRILVPTCRQQDFPPKVALCRVALPAGIAGTEPLRPFDDKETPHGR